MVQGFDSLGVCGLVSNRIFQDEKPCFYNYFLLESQDPVQVSGIHSISAARWFPEWSCNEGLENHANHLPASLLDSVHLPV